MNTEHNKTIDPNNLPDKDAFSKKEHYQHPQPADTGKPLNEKDTIASLKGKQAERSSKEEGINEKNSAGDAGPFEGFEDQGKD